MKKNLFRKVLCFILSVTTLFGAVGVSASAASYKGDESTSATLEEMESLVGTLSYAEYLKTYSDVVNREGLGSISVDVTKFEGNGSIVSESDACTGSMSENPDAWAEFGDENKDTSVYLPATGSVTWQFKINDKANAGLYNLKIVYYNCDTRESSISSIERKLFINGKVPYSEATTLTLSKNWVYDNETVVVHENPESTDLSDGVHTEYVRTPANKKKGETGKYEKIVKYVEDGKIVKTVTYVITQDINGNSMSPEIAETSKWNTYICSDASGYESEYLKFYVPYGTHTITLQAEREPVIIKSIEFVPADNTEVKVPTYEEYLAQYPGSQPATDGEFIRLEGEFPNFVSDSSVSSSNDNTSAESYPVASNAQLYNVIGETSYSAIGQWAAYKFTVNQTGLYKFALRYKQSALQGMFICRSVKLSGGDYGTTPQLPYAEAANAEFQYNDEWQVNYLSTRVTNEQGETELFDFQFYFEEGVEYTIYLECALGSLREYIQRVETSLLNINNDYLTILKLTGSDPDEYGSYNFVGIMPEVLVSLLEEARNLTDVADKLEALCGTNGSHLATLDNIARILDKMGRNDGVDIPTNLATLKTYLGTLGTWINDSKASSLMLDAIYVVPSDTEIKELPVKAKANFLKSLWHEVKSFFSSFYVNYDAMGLTRTPDENTTTIDVWLAEGRDQSQIWRTMIDAEGSFTDSTGVAVTLKLVTAGTLLPSILSGKGPDVYMGLGAADVINYAIRNAVVSVSEDDVFTTHYYTYEDEDGYKNETEKRAGVDPTFETMTFNELVEDRFAPAAMDTVTLLDVSYGIPQTMTFAMMFYRMDILAELGQEVPETWGELLSILPVLQSNNMEIGVSYISAIDFMIYQEGGNMWKYADPELYDSRYAGAKIDLDSEIAAKAFDFTCRLYSDYSFPVSYDAANRFRTGEMPILIGDYVSIYNTLVVYATEIEGLWEFCSLPGSVRADGTYNYDSLAGVTSTVMLHGCDNKLAAWQYMQWETSDSSQSNYGNRMVALIGPSAKYATANTKALEDLSWTSSEKEAIRSQMNHLSSIVNYPGSYIITRYMQFAFLDAVNDGADPVESLRGYVDAINAEITRKREEFKGDFDLWIDDGEEPPMKTAG